MQKKNKDLIQEEIKELLDIEDKSESVDLVNYLNDLDIELQRLIRNLLKLKNNADRATIKETVESVKVDKFLEFYLCENGFIVENNHVMKDGIRYKVFENTFSYLKKHNLFQRKHTILIVQGEKNKSRILKVALLDNPVFMRLTDNSIERLA
jgi:hypothetical protein